MLVAPRDGSEANSSTECSAATAQNFARSGLNALACMILYEIRCLINTVPKQSQQSVSISGAWTNRSGYRYYTRELGVPKKRLRSQFETEVVFFVEALVDNAAVEAAAIS